jgi:hypothetical protein
VPTLVLAGPPERLTGSVSIANTGAETLSVTGGRLLHDSLPHAHASLTAVVPSGATHTVGITASLDPATPAGEYAAQLEVGGQRRDVLVTIDESPSMSVRPARLYLGAGSEPVQLVVSNTGNVPVRLARTTAATAVVVIPYAVERGAAITLTLDPTAYAATGGSIPPGAAVTLPAQVSVPQELDPQRRHVALLPVGLADIRVVVAPRDPPPDPEPDPKQNPDPKPKTDPPAGRRRTISPKEPS